MGSLKILLVGSRKHKGAFRFLEGENDLVFRNSTLAAFRTLKRKTNFDIAVIDVEMPAFNSFVNDNEIIRGSYDNPFDSLIGEVKKLGIPAFLMAPNFYISSHEEIFKEIAFPVVNSDIISIRDFSCWIEKVASGEIAGYQVLSSKIKDTSET